LVKLGLDGDLFVPVLNRTKAAIPADLWPSLRVRVWRRWHREVSAGRRGPWAPGAAKWLDRIGTHESLSWEHDGPMSPQVAEDVRVRARGDLADLAAFKLRDRRSAAIPEMALYEARLREVLADPTLMEKKE